MNIIEAIKSGKPFRCHPAMSWVYVKSALLYYNRASDGAVCEQPLTVDLLISDDWEIQEPTVTITRTHFYDMAYRAFGARDYGKGLILRFDDEARVKDLARKLGLED